MSKSIPSKTAASVPDNERQSNQHIHSFSKDSVGKLYLKLSVAMAIGMLINGMYSLVDAYFIGTYVGPIEFAAVSTVFPIQMLQIAFAALISSGASILVSRYLGSGDNSQLKTCVISGVVLILMLSLFMALLLIGGEQTVLPLIGVTPSLLPLAVTYYVPLVAGSALIFLLFFTSDLLRAYSNMKGLLNVILLGALTNVVLDWLFIATLHWGLAGAAYATLISQALGVCLAIKLLGLKRYDFANLSVDLGGIGKQIRLILGLGLPALSTYLGAALVVGSVNHLLATYGTLDIANWIGAYGLLGRLNVFCILPLIAITNACQTIVSYNYGAAEFNRVDNAIKLGLVIAMVYLLVVALGLITFAGNIAGLFTDDDQLKSTVAKIASIMFLLMPLAGLSGITVAGLQSTNRPKQAMLLSFAKIYLVLVPALFLLTQWVDVTALWYAFPIAELVMLPFLVLSAVTMIRRVRQQAC
ncbi:MATE family efflux transporter [Alteromonas facilis]|uniref:MATE family efflux transporter n=1 Tax=Alteromonas facilis TaxID=2048004 RepID=UPI000C28143E|nr:MATE family efflux transporter [Alteromonas facilis]